MCKWDQSLTLAETTAEDPYRSWSCKNAMMDGWVSSGWVRAEERGQWLRIDNTKW